MNNIHVIVIICFNTSLKCNNFAFQFSQLVDGVMSLCIYHRIVLNIQLYERQTKTQTDENIADVRRVLQRCLPPAAPDALSTCIRNMQIFTQKASPGQKTPFILHVTRSLTVYGATCIQGRKLANWEDAESHGGVSKFAW